MRVIPFLVCVAITAVLITLYIAKHNVLTEYRIRVLSLEKEISLQEAQLRQYELEMALFESPIRLTEIAKKAQYAHLKTPARDELSSIEVP